MHLARTLAVKLLRRQEWGRTLAAPRRRGALSAARKRRFAGASGNSRLTA